MTMKKLLFLLMVLALIVLTAPAAAAEDALGELQSDTQDAIGSLIGSDVTEALQAFGMDSLDPQAVFDVSIDNVTAFFSQSLSSTLRAVGTRFIPFFSALLLIVLVRVLTRDAAAGQGLRLVCVSAVVLFSTAQLEPLVNTVLSAMRIAAMFLHGYIPIYAGLLAFSGVPTSAAVYSGVVFSLSQAVAAFCDGGCVTMIGCYFSLLIAQAFFGDGSTARFVNGMNRALSVLMGLLASVFAATLGVRSALSASLDAASVKSVRFLISNLIPVVGSSISDAYAAVLGSVQLIRGSVAVVGILVLLILMVPPILETVLVYFLLLFSATAAQLLDCDDLAALLRGFGVGVRFLLLAAVLELFAVLIATGIMLSLKGGT